MKTSAILLLAAACFLAAVPARSGERSARDLIDQSVEASGGMEAMGAWKTMTRTGDLVVHWEGWGTPRAKCSLKVKRPDKLVLDQDFSAYDHPFFFTYWYNGGEVWAMVNLGVRQHPRYTEAMTRAMKNASGMYYYAAECDTFFSGGDVPDDSLLAGRVVERVGVVDDGDTVMVDLDPATHLPVRLVRDNGAEQTFFTDYRDVDGMMVPFAMTVYQGGAVSAEYTWETIVFDQPIDDAVFEENRPAEQASG
jgi:hypothetical protein